MLSMILALAIASASPGEKRPFPVAGPSAPCRERDGRIRIHCLPRGTLRALPVLTPQALPAPSAAPRPEPTASNRSKTGHRP